MSIAAMPAPPADPTFRTSRTSQASWTASGRLRATDLPDFDRNYALVMHLAPIAALILGPAVALGVIAVPIMWMVKKGESTFIDDHGRDLVNFGISMFLLSFGLMMTLIGAILVPVLLVVAAISMIRGAMAAGNGEYFRYPMTFRFFK